MQSFRKIAIIGQKGGVGKTTLSVNLAVAAEAAGIRTALFDLDPQESATVWADRRKAETPHVEFLTLRRLADALQTAEAQSFALVILDTPPAAGPEAYAAAQSADVILVPCGTSLVDLDAIKRTALMVKSVGVPAFAVFNEVPPGATVLLEDARTLVGKEGLEIAPVVVRARGAFRASWPLGKSVAEIEPNGKAAQEISKLQNWIFAKLHVCTHSKRQVRTPAKTKKVAAHG
jgi:chromosome partitioning protein